MSVVLVTGGSSGIGLATAVAFARRGDHVFATVRSDEARAAVAAADARIEPVAMDVTDQVSVDGGVAEVVTKAGTIDVVINNAGVAFNGAVETTPDDVWRDTFEVNFFGTVRVCRAVLPVMRRQRSGVIVNVTSANGRIAVPFAGAYSASKFAVEGLSDSMAIEVAPFGVRVHVVEPGQFDTPIFGKMKARTGHMRPDSPYAAAEQKALAATLGNSPPDPAGCAQVIVDVATGERPGYRHAAGEDAIRLLALRQQTPDDQWMQMVRDFVS